MSLRDILKLVPDFAGDQILIVVVEETYLNISFIFSWTDYNSPYLRM